MNDRHGKDLMNKRTLKIAKIWLKAFFSFPSLCLTQQFSNLVVALLLFFSTMEHKNVKLSHALFHLPQILRVYSIGPKCI